MAYFGHPSHRDIQWSLDIHALLLETSFFLASWVEVSHHLRDNVGEAPFTLSSQLRKLRHTPTGSPVSASKHHTYPRDPYPSVWNMAEITWSCAPAHPMLSSSAHLHWATQVNAELPSSLTKSQLWLWFSWSVDKGKPPAHWDSPGRADRQQEHRRRLLSWGQWAPGHVLSLQITGTIVLCTAVLALLGTRHHNHMSQHVPGHPNLVWCSSIPFPFPFSFSICPVEDELALQGREVFPTPSTPDLLAKVLRYGCFWTGSANPTLQLFSRLVRISCLFTKAYTTQKRNYYWIE